MKNENRLKITNENKHSFDETVSAYKKQGIDPVVCEVKEASLDSDSDECEIIWYLKEEVSPEVREAFSKYLEVTVNSCLEKSKFWAGFLADKNMLGKQILTQDILTKIKEYGFPKDDVSVETVFNLFRKVGLFYRTGTGDDYSKNFPVDYDALRMFSSDFDENWGISRIINLTDEAGIPYDDGHMRELISSSKLTRGEKAFLLYAIC